MKFFISILIGIYFIKFAEAQRWGMGRGYGRNYDDGNGDDNYDYGDDGNDGDDSSSSCTVYEEQEACPSPTELECDICKKKNKKICIASQF